MKRKLFDGLLFTAVMCLIMCTAVMAEDVPMTEEEIINVEENFSVETEDEEELIVAEEEEEFLEADGLVEDEEILEAAEDFSFNTAIPDSTFQTFLKERGLTTLDRISEVTELNLAGMGIKDLTGIEYFTKLKKLNCSSNLLTNLDVSSLTALEELKCDSNHITNLDVSGCTTLKKLEYSGDDYLESLNVTGCTALEILRCEGTPLKSLDVSTCPELKELYCYLCGPIAALNISGCKKLEVLDCSEARLTSLDMSGFTSLRELTCLSCGLTSLDVTGCTKLEELYCMENSLTSLDISSCISLKHLHCEENQLTSLDVSFCPNLTDRKADESTTILYKHEHEWDDGVVTKEATTTEEGVKTYTCIFAGCRQTKTESIPKIIEPPQENTTLTEQITISKKPTIKKPAATKNKITVKWKHFKHTSKKGKKIWKPIKKVQVQCATDSAFTNIVKSTMVGKKKTKATIKGLAKKTTYYVRVRYYDGTGYSAWSKVKKVKTK